MNGRGDDRRSYIPGWSTAGFIVYDPSGKQRFDALWAAHYDPTILPNDSTICASTRGLILCHNAAVTLRCPYAYAVSNPYIPGAIRRIPNPNPLHEGRIPRVLVVYVHPTTRLRIFHIVCASLEGDCDSPVYSVDVYSSNTDRWSSSGSHDLGFLREDTGVSCGTKAYWLRRDAPTAVHYDAMTNSVGSTALPDAYVWLFSQPGNLRSQLGELRNRLCLVVVTENLRAVYTAGAGGGWVCNCQDIVEEVNLQPVLSRFQDYRLLVPFWFKEIETLEIWDSNWVDHMRRESIFSLPGQQVDFHKEILPLVRTRLHPFRDFPYWPR